MLSTVVSAASPLIGIAVSYAITAPHPLVIHWPAPAGPRRIRRMPNTSWIAVVIACLMVAVVLSALIESVIQ